MGDGNRISLLDHDMVYRTAVLTGRPVNDWQLGTDIDSDLVRKTPRNVTMTTTTTMMTMTTTMMTTEARMRMSNDDEPE